MRLAKLNPFRYVRELYDYMTQRIANRRFYLWGDTAAGVQVSHEVAMALSVYGRCVAIIAGDLSCLGLNLKHRRADGGKDLAIGHPDYARWSISPAPYLTRQRYVEQMMGGVLCRGNNYSDIEYRGGRLYALHPLDVRLMEPLGLKDDVMIYRYEHPVKGAQFVDGRRVLHVRGYSEDGLVGMSPLRSIRNSIGLAVAQETYGARFFKNGSVPNGVLTYPGVLTDDDFTEIKSSWTKNQAGENQNGLAILDRGLTWTKTGIAPEEAQFLESRRASKADIAGWFGVPLYRLNELERATWSNVENVGQDYVTYTLVPWATRIESEINLRFYPEGEYFVEFDFTGLLRGDSQARSSYYRTLFGLGAMTINEIRHGEGFNPVGDVGDIHWMPLNIAPASDALTSPDQRGAGGWGATGSASAGGATGSASAGGASAERALGEYLARMLPHLPIINPAGPPAEQARAVALDAAGRILRKESRALANAVQRHLARGRDDLHAFAAWGERFYAEQRDYFLQALRPAADLLGTAGQLDAAASAYVRDAMSQISAKILDVHDLAAWAAQRPGQAEALIESLLPPEG